MDKKMVAKEKMDKHKKKLCRKSMEVVWRREDGPKTRYGPNDLPEMKEIDLENSVKKPAQFASPSRIPKINKKNKNRVHKRVRRSLFSVHKTRISDKYFDAHKSKKKLSEPRRELSRPNFPQTVLNQGKTWAHESKPRTFQTETISKTVESSSSQNVQDTSSNKRSTVVGDQINPHAIDHSSFHSKVSDMMSNWKLMFDDLGRIDKSDHDKSNTDKNKLVVRHRESCYNITGPRKSSDSNLSAASITCPKSPLIMSNREKNITDLNASYNELHQRPLQPSKSVESPDSCSVRETSIIESSNKDEKLIIPPTICVLQSKSPEIMSNRKRCYELDGRLDQINGFKQGKLNVALSLPNEKPDKLGDPVMLSRKKSDSLPEASQILTRPKSPQIMSNKKKLEISLEDPLCESTVHSLQTAKNSNTVESLPQYSIHDTPVKSSSTTRSRITLRASNSGRAKSPEIASNRKRRYYEDGSLNATNEFNRDDLNVVTNTLIENRHKPCDSVPCSRKISNSLLEASQVLARPRSPFIMSNKKKMKISLEASFCESKQLPLQTVKQFKTDFQFSDHDTSIINPSNTVQNEQYLRVGDIGHSKSPEIMSNRKRKWSKINESDYGKLEGKVNVTANTIESITNDHNSNVTSSKNKCNSLFEDPQTSFSSGSSQIISNRKNTKMEKNTLIPNSKRRLFQVAENVGADKLLPSHSISDSFVDTSNTVQNQAKPLTDYKFCRRKSPEIMSNRKLRIGCNDSDKINVSEFDKSCTSASGLKENDRQFGSGVISPKKRSDGLYKTPQDFTDSKIVQIIPNRERINTVEDTWLPMSKRRLFQTMESAATVKILPLQTAQVPSVEPLNPVKNRIEPSADRDIFESKFPVLNANQKHECIEYKNLEVDNVINLPLKSNSAHSEDIVESSEIICLKLNKQILKKNKTRRLKKSKVKRHVRKKQADELMTFVDGSPKIILQENEVKNDAELIETNKNDLCDELMCSNCTDIIHTEHVVKSPFAELKIKNRRKKVKKSLIELQDNQRFSSTELKLSDVQRRPEFSLLSNTKELINKDDLTTLKPLKKEYLNKDKNKKIVTFAVLSPEISVVPATPERDAVSVDKAVIENFSETLTNLSVPLIEVDQSPKTPQGKNQRLALIQSVFSPPNEDCESSSGLFEPVTSPAQCPSNYQTDVKLPFKIDSSVSPASAALDYNLFSPEPCRKKMSKNSPSPSHFDSAKKRKKVCKDGLRGKFRELINRKKSEACIREYEKTLSKDYQQKQHGETVLLNVIEVWKEFTTFVLLCYQAKVKKVLVTLDNCPKNVIKNSIIRIYPPWSTVESKTIDLLVYVGVVHAEIIESPGPTRLLGPLKLFPNCNKYQSEVLWKCKCSKDIACQCLGDLSVYNYLQYMVSH